MQKIICLNCFHEWITYNPKDVLRCSQCHRNQGVSYEKYRKAVNVVKDMLRAIAKSPPPHPPPIEVIGYIPEALKPVLGIAKDEFPSPLAPFSFVIEVLKQAHKELKKEDGNEKGG